MSEFLGVLQQTFWLIELRFYQGQAHSTLQSCWAFSPETDRGEVEKETTAFLLPHLIQVQQGYSALAQITVKILKVWTPPTNVVIILKFYRTVVMSPKVFIMQTANRMSVWKLRIITFHNYLPIVLIWLIYSKVYQALGKTTYLFVWEFSVPFNNISVKSGQKMISQCHEMASTFVKCPAYQDFFNLVFTACQDYFSHFEQYQSSRSGKMGKSLRATTWTSTSKMWLSHWNHRCSHKRPSEPPHDKPNKMMCAQRRLRSASASLQSDQSLRFCMKKHWALNYLLTTQWRLGSLDSMLLHADSEDSDQTGRMPGMSFCWFCHAAAQVIITS